MRFAQGRPPGLTDEDLDEFERRLSLVAATADAEGFDAIIAIDDGSFSVVPCGHTKYLSNYSMPATLGMRHQIAVVVPVRGEPALVVPDGAHGSRDLVARFWSVIERVYSTPSPPDVWPPAANLVADITTALKDAGCERGRVGICGNLPRLDALRQALPHAEFRTATQNDSRGTPRDIVERVRAKKSDWEKERLRRAQEACNAGMSAFVRAAIPGDSTYDLVLEADYAAQKHGADETHTIMLAGTNPLFWASKSGPRRTLAEGDLVCAEFNARVDGYIAQMARGFTIGDPSPAQARVIETGRRALEAMIDVLRTGATAGQLWDVGAQVVGDAGLEPWGRYGHGLGLSMAEGFDILKGDNMLLTDGHCVTVHAGVIDGEAREAALVGDTFIMEADGPKPLCDTILPYEIESILSGLMVGSDLK